MTNSSVIVVCLLGEAGSESDWGVATSGFWTCRTSPSQSTGNSFWAAASEDGLPGAAGGGAGLEEAREGFWPSRISSSQSGFGSSRDRSTASLRDTSDSHAGRNWDGESGNLPVRAIARNRSTVICTSMPSIQTKSPVRAVPDNASPSSFSAGIGPMGWPFGLSSEPAPGAWFCMSRSRYH